MPPRDKLPILDARKAWDCPNCETLDETNEAKPHTRMHTCAGLGGLTVPMVEASRHAPGRKTDVRVRAVVREDYEGKEHGLTRDSAGRPIMAVVTDYADGSNDAAVFAPAVRVEMRS